MGSNNLGWEVIVKLFVWKSVFDLAVFFALAENITDAREAIIANHAEWWWGVDWNDTEAAYFMSLLIKNEPDVYDQVYGSVYTADC